VLAPFDSLQISSAEDRLRGRRLLGCAFVCALLSALALLIDLPVRDAVSGVGGLKLPGDLRRAVGLAEVFAHGFGVLACIAVALTLDPRGWRIAPRLMIGAYGTGLLVDLCKLQVARVRPKFATTEIVRVADTFLGVFPWRAPGELAMPLNNHVRSFPSGHTGTAVGLAIALTVLYPRGRWLFALFAVLAAMQRMESGMHYLSDTLAAAAIGFLVGAGLCGRTKLNGWLQRLEAEPQASGGVLPQLNKARSRDTQSPVRRAG
jgi:membrane-associated phospholipid phosphatase